MYRQFILLTASLALATFTAHTAWAGTSDFNKPIKVDAKSQFVDGKNKTSLFKDDVRITQGTLVIEAKEVEVIASEGEGREIFVARGEPASYTQQMDDGSVVNARANEIRYEVSKRTISLTGSAELQQDTSMVKGDSITYDMAKEQLLATSSDEDSEGRVTTVFRPETIKSEGDEPEPEDTSENSSSEEESEKHDTQADDDKEHQQ